MEQTRIFTALKGVRGRKPVDLARSKAFWCASASWWSNILASRKSISILCWPRRSDCWRSTRAWSCTTRADGEELPKPAIRPYPAQYVCPWTMKDGTGVTLRPIRPEDEPLMVAFHETLSDRSVYSRYFSLDSA